MSKPVILIGGAAGVGKTTLARYLSCRLKIDHRLGTGFIREIIRGTTSKKEHPELFSYTFRGKGFMQNFIKQSELLFDAVRAAIERANREGTSLIVEGNHLLPELYADLDVDMFMTLFVEDVQEHRQRLEGSTHKKRSVSKSDFENVLKIQRHILQTGKETGIKPVFYKDNLEEIINMLDKQR